MSRPISIRATRRGTPTVRIGTSMLAQTYDTVVDLDDPSVLRDLHRYADAWVTSVATDGILINVKDMGAKGDGVTDDTAAFTAAINRLNLLGGILYLPYGQYVVSSALPSITKDAVSIVGTGWAQTNFTHGSVISAGAGLSSTVLTLLGEGIEVRGITVDGEGRAATLVAVAGSQCRLLSMEVRGVAATSGVCVDVQAGGSSIWMDNCRISGINYPNSGIQINDTDAIITNCKPVNNTYNVVLLGGASGTILANNHMTPGSGGANGVLISSNPSHVQISGNRFDNYVQSGIQITPPASTPNSIHITDNHFHSTVQTDNTYAAIAVDTTASGVRGLHIVGNSVYGSATNRPKWFLSAQKQDGSTPTNTGRLASLGTLCNSNTAWAATAFQGNGAPTIARGNMTATDGQTYVAVADI